MRPASIIAIAFVFVLITSAIAYLTLEKQPDAVATAPSEQAPSQSKFETVVGDETPFSPEW